MNNKNQLNNFNDRGGIYDVTKDYKFLIHKLSKHFNVKEHTLWILSHPTIGDYCIYSNEIWLGYINDQILEKIK
jgi:hypothetical protein